MYDLMIKFFAAFYYYHKRLGGMTDEQIAGLAETEEQKGRISGILENCKAFAANTIQYLPYEEDEADRVGEKLAKVLKWSRRITWLIIGFSFGAIIF